MGAEQPGAIGRLPAAGGAWFGVGRGGGGGGGGYRLVFGEPDGTVWSPRAIDPDAARADLLHALIAFFEAEGPAPPPELEATHGDVADALRDLAARSSGGPWAGAVREAVDAIDDGLPADAVIGHLERALPPTGGPGEPEGRSALAWLAERRAAARR